MSRRRNHWGVILGSSVGFGLAAMALALPASAHISLELGGTHKSRYGDGELKSGPCGRTGGARGPNVYTYASGQKITVALVEFIVHPSYFRFAFDDDGDDAFIEPASIKPIDPNRKCPTGPGDHCGASDFYNSPAVLPNMDNLNPHITAPANTKYTWEVTLPDVECTNCTLQVIQVMQDDLAHGPYDPTPGVGIADIYHQCIDIVLQRSGDAGVDASNDAATAADGSTLPPRDASATDAGGGGSPGDGGRGSDAGTGTGPDGSIPRDGSGSTGIDTMTPPTSDAGGGSGGRGGTGSGGTGGGNGTGSGGTGGASSGASGASAGTGPSTGGGTGSTGDGNGCSCTVVEAPAHFGAAAGWSLLALALASRRRRR